MTGISDSDWNTLKSSVNIIFHCAASVRFDDSLSKAILANVRSTRELIQLALETEHLKAFIHVSTAYCNALKGLTDVHEKLYPQNGDWKDAIKIAEEGQNTIIDNLALKYINPHSNTYTYAKSLAEHCVNDMCLGRIPTAIIRPTMGKSNSSIWFQI